MGRAITWSVTQSGPFDTEVARLVRNTKDASAAFDEAADVIADRQKAWFASGGGGTWAPRKEPYHTRVKKKFPKRKVMHGPDTKNHRGLQLRDQLTRRDKGSFGVENIGPTGMTVGTDLPYAEPHQKGEGRLPVRIVMPPLDTITEQKIVKILQAHIVGEVIG